MARIVWNHGHSLASFMTRRHQGFFVTTFRRLKRYAQGTMVPIDKYKVRTGLLKKEFCWTKKDSPSCWMAGDDEDQPP